MLVTQDTGYSFDTATLVVPFSRLNILCSIRIVSEVTINNSIFKVAVSIQCHIPNSETCPRHI